MSYLKRAREVFDVELAAVKSVQGRLNRSFDQAGELRVAEGEVADDFMMATMDWYVQGIDGELPQ